MGTVELGEGLFYYVPSETLKLLAIKEKTGPLRALPSIYQEIIPIQITGPDPEPIILDHGEGDVTPPVGTHLYELGATVNLLAYPAAEW